VYYDYCCYYCRRHRHHHHYHYRYRYRCYAFDLMGL
jgi:hypothetical protein